MVAEFARAGFRTTGLDKDPEKVRLLNAGESYIADVPTGALAPHVKARRLDASTDPAVLREADAVIVCVPTPLNKTRDPDMRLILPATQEIARYQHDGMLVILESTTYPGTTTEVLVPKIDRKRRGARAQRVHRVFSGTCRSSTARPKPARTLANVIENASFSQKETSNSHRACRRHGPFQPSSLNLEAGFQVGLRRAEVCCGQRMSRAR